MNEIDKWFNALMKTEEILNKTKKKRKIQKKYSGKNKCKYSHKMLILVK